MTRSVVPTGLEAGVCSVLSTVIGDVTERNQLTNLVNQPNASHYHATSPPLPADDLTPRPLLIGSGCERRTADAANAHHDANDKY